MIWYFIVKVIHVHFRPFDAKNPFMSPVSVNRELHKGGERSCMHIELDITGSKIRYEAGDHVAVYPTNDSVLVEGIGKRLDVDLDTIFSLDNVDGELLYFITIISIIIQMYVLYLTPLPDLVETLAFCLPLSIEKGLSLLVVCVHWLIM